MESWLAFSIFIHSYLVEPYQLISKLNTQRGLRGLPSPGRRSFLSTPQKGTQKVTAEGTGLPWLALRRREANSHTLGVLRQVPPVAPDAAPSLRPNPLGGSWI